MIVLIAKILILSNVILYNGDRAYLQHDANECVLVELNYTSGLNRLITICNQTAYNKLNAFYKIVLSKTVEVFGYDSGKEIDYG